MPILFFLLEKISFWITKTLGSLFWKIELLLKGISFSEIQNVVIIGRPIISLAYNSKIHIGKNVILMSNSKYCLSSSLYSPCKLKTITRNAIIEIGDNTSFNGTSITCRSTKIFIGSRTMVGPNVTILDSPFHPMSPIEKRNYYPDNELDKPVYIGEDVWIGSQVIILPGSKIGNGSVIGAGSIVSGNIPENVLAIGSPARVIRNII